jgi:hypothetical protein
MDHYEMRKALERAILHPMNVSKHSVWVMMSNRQRVDKLAEFISSANFSEISNHARSLATEFSNVERSFLSELNNLDYDDASLANKLSNHPNAIVLQMMLNGEDYAQLIWKMIEPEQVNAGK